MGTYLTTNDVKGKAIDTPLQRASWLDSDVEKCIEEAENYIEGRLIRIGYSRIQLLTAPLVKSLCINYARYCILRDIYTQTRPSTASGEPYEKWKTEVDAVLEKIETYQIRLFDLQGVLISPPQGDQRLKITSTTRNVNRAITMGPSYEWGIDDTYSSEEVVGKKPGV